MALVIDRDMASPECVVRLDGDLDLAVVPELREQLSQVVETGCEHIVLDMERVTYLDSTALGLIVWLDRQLAPDGRVALVGMNPDVKRIVELSGLLGTAPTLRADETLEEALRDVKESEGGSPCLKWCESLSVPAQAEALADARAAVVTLLSAAGLADNDLLDAKVAVGEALANAVRHGSPGGSADQIRVDIGAYDDRVTVQVRDAGHGFEPHAEQSGAASVFAPSGRGIAFMRRLMDDVSFSRDPVTGGTVVTLQKRLRLRKSR
ncbi:MAG: hypothetical protein Kow0056_04940 [Coriobacteriia bacterium]